MIHLNKWEKKYTESKNTYNIGDYICLKIEREIGKYFEFCKIIDINKKTQYKIQSVNEQTNSIESIWIYKNNIIRKLKSHEIEDFNSKLSIIRNNNF